MRRAATGLAIVLLCAAARGENRIAECDPLRRLGARMELLVVGEICCGNGVGDVGDDQRRKHADEMRELRAIKIDDATLQQCAGDDDAKVRTLALALAFERMKFKALPLFVAHANDDAPAFAAPQPFASTMMGGVPPSAWERKKVSDYARVFADVYLGPLMRRPKQGEWEAFWNARKGRAWSFSAFAAEARKACHSVMEPRDPKSCEGHKEIRAAIDKLPRRDRAIELLLLRDVTGGYGLVSDAELIEIARTLDHADLLALVQRKLRSDDPDVVPSTPTYESARVFVLQHAKELFTSEDAKILAAESDSRAKLAAALLDPAHGAATVHQEIATTNEWEKQLRAELVLALWQLRGREESQFVRDELFGNFSFLLHLMRQPVHPDYRSLVAELVSDPRFEKVQWAEQRQIAVFINDWSGKKTFSEDELGHAFRVDERGVVFDWNDRREPPAEAYRLEAAEWLAAFRLRLVEATKSWKL